MVVSASHELAGFGTAVAASIILGIIYDFMRAIRRVSGKNFLADTLCWIFMCMVGGGIWLELLDGELRWYMFLGAFLGAVLYAVLAERYIFFVFLFIVKIIWRFFYIILKFLLTPLIFLCKMIGVYIRRARTKFFGKVEDENEKKKACV